MACAMPICGPTVQANKQEMHYFITKAARDPEERLKPKLRLAMVRRVHKEFRGEVQNAMANMKVQHKD